MMRPTSALLALGWLSVCYPLATLVPAAEVFPYVMLASADKTPVRAAPNRQLELTDELRQGAPVEVYKQGDDGWLAIRPLFGHFSWVETKHIKMSGVQNIAEVTTEGAEAWVGTRFSDARLVSQIELKLGERVEVLETKRLTAPNGSSELWSRIMPPDGEFRWVEAKDFYRSGSKPPLVAPPAEAPLTAAPLTAAPLANAPPADAPLADAPPIAPSAVPLVLEPTTKEAPLLPAKETPSQPEGWVSSEPQPAEASPSGATPAAPMVSAVAHEGGTAPAAGRPTPAAPAPIAPAAPADGTPAAISPPGSGQASGTDALLPVNLPASNVGGKQEPAKAFANEAEFITALEAIELDLSMMAAQPPQHWQLENLKLRVAAMSEAATNPFQRGRTRLMLDKLEQFADIQVRHEKLKTYPQIASRMPSGRLAFVSPPADAAPSSASRLAPRGGMAPPYTPSASAGSNPPGRFTPMPSASPAATSPAAASPAPTGPAPLAPFPTTPIPTTPIPTAPVAPGNPSASWRAAGSSSASAPVALSPAASDAAPFSTPLAVRLPSPAPGASLPNNGAPGAALHAAVNSPPSLHTVYGGLDPQFDGTGWLIPTVSRREDIPRYMLVDEQGKLIQFVSPSPGVYLQRFVRTRVGIYGQRGFAPEFGKPHLTAERVTVLEGTKR